MATLDEYMAGAVESFGIYLANNGDNYRAWDAEQRKNDLAARLHEIGCGVADCGGSKRDAESLGSPLWSEIVKRLVLAGVRLDISGIRFVIKHLVVGYEDERCHR